jgi:DNA-binding LacI/PurR family transcriptional regulator
MSTGKPKKLQGKSFVSAQQVAERAGVSRSAVSRTFTDGASVSEGMRKRVIEAADALGYHVNHLARGLMIHRSNIVSLVVTDINTPYQAKMIEVLTRRLQEADKVAMVINTSGESASVETALRKTLHYRADATVVLSGQPAGSLIETCLANGQHVILVNRDDPVPGPETIIVTNREAAREAFHMLHRAGCKRLAVVASDVGTSSVLTREQAFVEAAAEAGVEVAVTRLGPTAYVSGAQAARLVLSRANQPDGIFCVTDLIACGFMDVARHEFGLAIPDELCVVGFDDIEQAGWSSYELTTFRQPLEQIVAHVVDLIGHPPLEQSVHGPIHFQAEPVWRRSVRPR